MVLQHIAAVEKKEKEEQQHCSTSCLPSTLSTMLTPLINGAKSTTNSVTTTVSSLFWTVFYFFYFLVKGKPEWKCDRLKEKEVVKNCCVAGECSTDKSCQGGVHTNGNINTQSNGISNSYDSHRTPVTSKPTSFASNQYSNKGIFSRAKDYIGATAQYLWGSAKKGFNSIFERTGSAGKVIHSTIAKFINLVKAFFASNLPSKSLPVPTSAAPKPFSPTTTPDSPTYNKVNFVPESFEEIYKEQHLDEEDYIMEKPEEAQSEPPTPAPRSNELPSAFIPAPKSYIQHREKKNAPSSPQTPINNPFTSFYAEKVFKEPVREQSIPPPAPPPPPSKPIRIGTSVDREMTKTPNNENKPKGGIPSFPSDVMAELAGQQRARQERGVSSSRELMTQSCHPDMPQWSAEKHEKERNERYDRSDRSDRSATATPWRACSVGPTMRRLEQVVSRLDDSSDNEAQFVFRSGRKANYDSSRPVTPALSTHSRCTTPYGHSSYQNQNSYEQSNYNRNEGVRQRSRTVGPYGREAAPVRAPFTQSTAYRKSPFTSHTAPSQRNSHTAAYDRGANFAYDRDGVTQGAVTSSVRCWPPASNATGADTSRDDWVTQVIGEADNGLITTMCRRVVEKKTEDNWKWRDEYGRLLDEKNQQSWKGELDTVLRDGPNQGRHWSRTVEMLPSGDTRFQDISRQYDNQYVVESVVRNY